MSIRDVAAMAGVSPATVSRVFTRPDSVAAETRRRVIEVAEELRYAPHPVARSLARRRTGNLGIVVPDIANSFSAVITKAVQHEARRDGYALFVAGSEEIAQDEGQWARAMAAQVDGVLLVSPQMPDDALLGFAEITPVVFTNRLLDGIPAVLTDTYEATGHAVEHLHALGHRELVYLAGPDGYSNEVRLRGFRDACGRLGITASELGPFHARFSAGVRAADLVLATSATGVVAYNDEVAVGVINRLADRGLRVPDDRSVVGFDDTQLAEMVVPRLTTVAYQRRRRVPRPSGCCSTSSGAGRSRPAVLSSSRVSSSSAPAPDRCRPAGGRGRAGHDGRDPAVRGCGRAAGADPLRPAAGRFRLDRRSRARPPGLADDHSPRPPRARGPRARAGCSRRSQPGHGCPARFGVPGCARQEPGAGGPARGRSRRCERHDRDRRGPDGLRPRPRPAGGLRRLRDHALDARAPVARRADGWSPDGLAGGRIPRRPRRVRRPDDGGCGGAVARAHLLP